MIKYSLMIFDGLPHCFYLKALLFLIVDFRAIGKTAHFTERLILNYRCSYVFYCAYWLPCSASASMFVNQNELLVSLSHPVSL